MQSVLTKNVLCLNKPYLLSNPQPYLCEDNSLKSRCGTQSSRVFEIVRTEGTTLLRLKYF